MDITAEINKLKAVAKENGLEVRFHDHKTNMGDFCKTAGLKTQKEVYDWLVADLTETYKGRAPKWRIESVAEDITESICLKLNIKQKGIR